MSIRPITRLPVLGLLLALTGCVHATDAEAGDHPGEAAFIDSVAGWVAVAIELAGIGIIVIGALIATGFFVRELTRGAAFDAAYHLYRGYLGRAILLGLEFLVAADIVGTVAVAPTFTNLGVLALIVLIRTFLSFSLEVEIDGHWPWQDSEKSRQRQREDAL